MKRQFALKFPLVLVLLMLVAAMGFAPASAHANGRIVFSKSPIAPDNPSNLATSFKACDAIYGLVQFPKAIKDIWPKATDIMIFSVYVDGKKAKNGHTVVIKNKAYRERNWLVFDVAPAPDQCTAYSDPGIFFGETKGMRRGAMIFSKLQLGALAPGKHEIKVETQYYGKVYATGTFTIDGGDYACYNELGDKLKAVADGHNTFPKAKMTNKDMANKMRSLLRNAGWPEIYRLNITDKDWWVQAGEFRYMAAAAMAKDSQGWYYKKCSFKQNKTLTGYGPLTLWDQGPRIKVTEKNKDD